MVSWSANEFSRFETSGFWKYQSQKFFMILEPLTFALS
jgi:hypothetical protein